MESIEVCPQCGTKLDGASHRLVQDACGHQKCRPCLLNDEFNCKLCNKINYEAKQNAEEAQCNRTPVNIERKDVTDRLTKTKPKKQKKDFKIPTYVSINSSDGYTCNICNRSFTTKSHVKYHLYCEGAKKPHSCEICKKEFIVKSHLQTHLLMHQDRKPYECEKCKKTFMERSKLNRHKLIHEVSKGFVCQECGKSFKNKENLRTHAIIHKPVKPYGCNECQARFNHSSNLKKHLQTHSKEKTHMCDQCGKRFKLKWALTVHRRSHSRIRPNECGTCRRQFVHAKDLQRHELTHLDTKDYKCGICGTSFKRKDNLHRHTRNTHPNKKAVIIKNIAKKKVEVEKSVMQDTPNAINVITASPSVNKIPEKQEACPVPVPVINAPLKLAFKTSAFKNHYNINIERNFVEPKKDVPESINIYEKILLQSTPTRTTTVNPILDKEPESYAICQKILGPFAPPPHYETSFDNKTHAIIKNIKFKLPAEYTNLKRNENATKYIEKSEEKTYTELKTVTNLQSVIVNSNNLHWRRRTADTFHSKESEDI